MAVMRWPSSSLQTRRIASSGVVVAVAVVVMVNTRISEGLKVPTWRVGARHPPAVGSAGTVNFDFRKERVFPRGL
jgi:hypothetical protein